MAYHLAMEETADFEEVEALFDTAFAPGREALSSYRLREGVAPVAKLCTVIRDELGILAGAVRFWPVQIGAHQALLLGPIAVHPTRQGEGVGSLLMGHALDAAAPWPRILLVGDAAYYRRFGFEPVPGIQMPPPTNPARVLGRGDWQGVTGVVAPAQPAPLATPATKP